MILIISKSEDYLFQEKNIEKLGQLSGALLLGSLSTILDLLTFTLRGFYDGSCRTLKYHVYLCVGQILET